MALRLRQEEMGYTNECSSERTHVLLSQAVVRLDGQYGNGAIVSDLAGLAYVMRGKDYDLLDLPQVQTRLTQLSDTHRETGTCRDLFDFPDLLLSPTGPRARAHFTEY